MVSFDLIRDDLACVEQKLREKPDLEYEVLTLAMEHLLELGHQRIAHISVGTKKPDGRCRLDVYSRMVECAGLTYDPSLIIESGSRPEDGYHGMKKLLKMTPILNIWVK